MESPDYDIIEETPRDWFPFIIGMGAAVCMVAYVIAEIVVMIK